MTPETVTTEALRASGHKLTAQRLIVATVLSESGGHMTAAQIVEQVRRRSPSLQYLGSTTVHRVLTLFRQLSLVVGSDLGSGELIYEWLHGDPHHHLVCRHCGSIQHFNEAAFDGAIQAIQFRHRFRAEVEHLALFGSCESCLNGMKESRPGARRHTMKGGRTP